ncbi:hypothetical protein HN011_004957 [Eciton burchellii]|nr:hypothetical protein HN011_004957 [Eciton burchellii]
MVDLGGYIIILTNDDGKIRLYGSPADSADTLEVGDEILEVNGRTLENATHNEVIQYIHQVIALNTLIRMLQAALSACLEYSVGSIDRQLLPRTTTRSIERMIEAKAARCVMREAATKWVSQLFCPFPAAIAVSVILALSVKPAAKGRKSRS